jgi:uncharacterized protein YqeY
MSLKNTIEEDLKTALKSGDSERLGTLRLIMSAVKNKEIEFKKELNDEEIIKILQTQAKQRKDSISAFNSGGRPDLASKEESELQLINSYLPAELPEEEIEKVVLSVINELNATSADFGAVIGKTMKILAGRASGQTVSEIVKRNLK